MRLATILLATTMATVGCLGTTDGPALDPAAAPAPPVNDPLGGFPDPILVGPDHDHGDIAAHRLATPTMHPLDYQSFTGVAGASLAFGEADLLGEDHLVVAALLDGFYVLDITDRAKPAIVSYTPNPGYNADIKASDTGNFVFIGVQLAGFTGIQAWNVMVRERPVLAGQWPMAGGCHMVAFHESHLYCAPNDGTVRIFEVTETPVAVAITPVGMYDPKGEAPPPVAANLFGAGEEFTHDMTVQADPLTGEAVMFVSFWDFGVHVVDVTDPSMPVELGVWNGEGRDDSYDGNLHTSMAALVGGRRVVATIPEYSATPAVTFLDATDYANMQVLGVWAPKKTEEFGDDDPVRFSTHNFQFVGGRVYLGMYHAGVWVIDASTDAALAKPTALGYFLPAEERGSAVPIFGGGGPSVWDVVVKESHIYATDIGTGLFTIHYTGDQLGDPARTSFA